MKRIGLGLVGITLCLLLPAGGWSQGKVLKNVSNDMVEKTLQSLDLKFEKGERKVKDSTIAYYDFKRDEQSYRLYNYVTDLWIECLFDKKLTPELVNAWNAQAKFSRAVLLEQKDKTSLSLESQLDCLGGVTDAMVKQFVNRFDEETKKFMKTLPK
jgi:hypothetical protein